MGNQPDAVMEQLQKRKNQFQKEKNEAATTKASMLKNYAKMVKGYKQEVDSFYLHSEEAFREAKASRESYHRGKFNGVDCIRIMESAEAVFAKLEESLIKIKDKTLVNDDRIKEKAQKYKELFICLDAIWSSVQGIEAGLLLTNRQVQDLGRAISNGKKLWMELELIKQQPKWHLLFDGHLLQEVKDMCGLADLSDAYKTRD
eukprot:11801879-Ditylum_brightwellii.AAC.1